MHTAVIELDALPDPIRPAAEDHDLAFVGPADFVVAGIVGGIVIRRVRLKFRSARVHQPVTRYDTEPLAQCSHFVFRRADERRNLAIGKSKTLGLQQERLLGMTRHRRDLTEPPLV